MTPLSERLVDTFADSGVVCAEQGVLPDAFDELTDRLAIRGLWCIGDVDQWGSCRHCGTIRNGHAPKPGCFSTPVWAPVALWRQFRYHVLRRKPSQ